MKFHTFSVKYILHFEFVTSVDGLECVDGDNCLELPENVHGESDGGLAWVVAQEFESTVFNDLIRCFGDGIVYSR